VKEDLTSYWSLLGCWIS